MGLFFNEYHPLIKHIIGLVERFGINENDFIPGTDYSFSIGSLDTEYTNGTIYKGGASLIDIENNDPDYKYYGWKTLFSKVIKIQDEIKKQKEEDAINKIIEEDTLKYLSKESEIQEAIDDYKLILKYKGLIQEIVKKWNTRYQSIFSNV